MANGLGFIDPSAGGAKETIPNPPYPSYFPLSLVCVFVVHSAWIPHAFAFATRAGTVIVRLNFRGPMG